MVFGMGNTLDRKIWPNAVYSAVSGQVLHIYIGENHVWFVLDVFNPERRRRWLRYITWMAINLDAHHNMNGNHSRTAYPELGWYIDEFLRVSSSD
jgi:hypothetical protein